MKKLTKDEFDERMEDIRRRDLEIINQNKYRTLTSRIALALLVAFVLLLIL